MKKTNLYLSTLVIMGLLASCSSNTGTTTTTDSTHVVTGMNPGDSAVTTTTTTTTTHHKYSGNFMPQSNVKYTDIRTHKQVSIRLDTTLGQIVNNETNEPMDLFVAPNSTDTIYGRTGTVVNNYIIKDESGNYNVDDSRVNNEPPTPASTTAPEPAPETNDLKSGTKNYKEKIKGDKSKIKTDDLKIKEKDDKIKIKER